MSNKNNYRANQRIRKDGKLYQPGQTMTLTEEEALPLHVSPIEGEDEGKKEMKVSTEGTADEAIAMIEQTPYAKLNGFVPEGEERKTVHAAWDKKQKEAKNT